MANKMTTNDELREAVAYAIEQSMPGGALGKIYTNPDADCTPMADAAISAIEPELRGRHRAELYAELIAVASNTTAFEQVTFGWLYGVADGEPLDDEGTVADWLRSRQEAETDDRTD